MKKKAISLQRGDVVEVLGFNKTFVYHSDFRVLKTAFSDFNACTLNFSDGSKMTADTQDFITVVDNTFVFDN